MCGVYTCIHVLTSTHTHTHTRTHAGGEEGDTGDQRMDPRDIYESYKNIHTSERYVRLCVCVYVCVWACVGDVCVCGVSEYVWI
jgi:hypothetical protein